MPFTAVLTSLPVAFAGMTDGMPSSVASAINGEASAEIGFGLFVKPGSSREEVLKLTAITEKIAGCVRHTFAVDSNELGTVGIKPDCALPLVRAGRVWVPCEEAVTRTDKVKIRAIAVGNEQAGAVRTTADASDLIDASAFCVFVDYDAGTGLALVEFTVAARNATPL